MNQTWENGKKKPIMGPILPRVVQIWTSKFLLRGFYFY